MKKIIDRVKKIEKNIFHKKTTAFPDNDDFFIDALGVMPENFLVNYSGHCGYDFISALNYTAANDWKSHSQ